MIIQWNGIEWIPKLSSAIIVPLLVGVTLIVVILVDRSIRRECRYKCVRYDSSLTVWIIDRSRSISFTFFLSQFSMLMKLHGKPRAIDLSGPSISWKCKCGQSELPEFPTFPNVCPLFTLSPFFTLREPGMRCA